MFSGKFPSLKDELNELMLTLIGDVSLCIQIFHQAQSPFMGGKRNRIGARARINKQQVDSIGPDVEHA